MAGNTFPRFNNDGDVELRFGESDEPYILHSYVLALHSTWFKASLSDRWNNNQDTSNNGKLKWVYELRFDKDTALGMFERVTSSNSSCGPEKEVFGGVTMEEIAFDTPEAEDLHHERVEVAKSHQQLLGTLYHVQLPEINTFDIEPPFLQLAKVAKIYGCEEIIGKSIDYQLRLCYHEVLQSCADAPISMLRLGIAVQSDWVFTEAATNLIGRSVQFYGDREEEIEEELGEEVLNLLNNKREEMVRALIAVEHELLLLYKASEKNWSAWAATTLFREWLTKALTDGDGKDLRPGYARVYRCIERGKFPYDKFVKEQAQWACVKAILKDCAENDRATLRAELDSVFVRAKKIIKPILKDETLRQARDNPEFRSLTFVKVRADELPWEKE